MINSNKVQDRIAAIQGKIIEGNRLKSCNQTEPEPLWKSLISSDCQFIFTQDRELFSNYFQIRRDSFHNDKYMRGHFNRGEPDIYDYKSDLLVACFNGEVIGGARFTYTTPEKRLVLPTECDRFTFKKTFSEYPLDKVGYGEVHRLVVIPQFRGKERNYVQQLLLRLYARAVELGLKYIFVPSIPLRCRLYRQLLSSLDLKLIIRPDIILDGSIPIPVSLNYIWGDALEEWERVKPDVKLINSETSITKSNDYWWGKGINYRMNPENIGCLRVARIDCCSLANNHVLDWGYSGLRETIATLKAAQIKIAGAGQDRQAAETPAIMEVKEKGRAIAFSFGVTTSGIPTSWAAGKDKPGVNLLPDLSEGTVQYIQKQVERVKRSGDVVIASIHWGDNWDYEISSQQIKFAHQLIDRAGVDLIHGHSSHHVKGIEIYRDRPIIYGCGDFIDDYEGIDGYETFRDDLGLMYFVTLDSDTGKLVNLQMIPTQIKCFKVQLASTVGILWLREILNREEKRFGTSVQWDGKKTLILEKLIPSSRDMSAI